MPAKSRANATKKKRSLGKTDRPVEVTLPSIDPETGEHNTCLARRPGPSGLVKLGILDSLDSLTALVNDKHLSDQKADADTIKRLAGSQKDLAKAMDLMDKVLVACVVDPPVARPPADGEPRDPELLYADDVDFEDKSFLLQWAMGGTGDWERFRRESKQLVDGVEAVPSLPMSTE